MSSSSVSSKSASLHPPSPPDPPEEPLASDCCGSGCATCVYDIYDQQKTRYDAELAAWKQAHGENHPLLALKVKKGNVHVAAESTTTTAELVDLTALREKLSASSHAIEDDDDEGDIFHDEQLPVASNRRPHSGGTFDNSVVTNLTQLPASVARGLRVNDEDDDAILSFRVDDDGQWSRVVSLSADRNVSYCTTTLCLSRGEFAAGASSFRPGDTVEVLCLPSRFTVEEFLRTFAAATPDEMSAQSRTGSLLEEHAEAEVNMRKTSKDNDSVTFPISDGVFLDVDRFPFVDSPLPPWLERCCSLLRTQRPELRTRSGIQTLSLGHLMRTVVDVSSWSAVQRPLLRRLLEVAVSKQPAEASESARQSLIQVDVLQALTRLPTAVVHDWVRCAWIVGSSNGDINDVGDLLRRFPSANLAFPEPLLHLPIRKVAVDGCGSVSFLLSCCFRESIGTQLFAPSAPLRDFTTGATKKVLTLPRLLEVAPPLRGRIFSVAAEEAAGKSLDLLSNCENQSNLWFSHFGAVGNAVSAPPWSGIVSAKLVSSSASKPTMFVRSGATLLATSNANKRKMLDRERGVDTAASRSAISFADSLTNLSLEMRNKQQQQTNAMFLCAGTGFAPFRFFLQRELAFASLIRGQQQQQQRNIHLTIMLGLRNTPCARSRSFFSSLLAAGVLSRVQIAVSSLSSSSREVPTPTMLSGAEQVLKVHSSTRVPDLITSVNLPRGPLHVFSCGPPSFVAACKRAVSSARGDAGVTWSHDDWSS